ncbi:right-handed parallel beta-helix repeat-containing protein [Cellulophaga sp. F20128]|uniref:right-handed parallel beta-helix repeat-containing protein n=1 Tax=Cellulophaga sp. F20128 TaxID=2926413 RepID=UPI001FF55771|nr:right-handed parallel beta-helix repeat-containing protein [Cellulophaga sp. F20128]MCK0157892.1 right-handed parallel beta-helix repeat-containing protein [Cellulophaga sp. F20128]
MIMQTNRLLLTVITGVVCVFLFANFSTQNVKTQPHAFKGDVIDTLVTLQLVPGDNIQAAIHQLNSQNGGTIVLGKGTYVVNKSLTVYSNITIKGYSDKDPSGVVITVEDLSFNKPIIHSKKGIHNLHFENFKVQGNLKDAEQHLDPTYHSKGKAKNIPGIRNSLLGILLTADGSSYANAKSAHITMKNIEVSNCAMGIHIKGARDVTLTNMNLHTNGMIESYYHNLYFRRVFKCLISDSKMYNSPTGNGINISQSEEITLTNNECYGNFFRGLRVEGERGYRINQIEIAHNICTNNGDIGIRLANILDGLVHSNTATANKKDTHFRNTAKVSFESNSWQ